MFTTILAGAAAAPAPATNFDILHAMNEGGVIAWGTAAILTVMLFFSLFILFTKVFEQQKVLNQYQRVRATFWQSGSLREGAAKLEKNSAYRQIVDDALLAQDQYKELTDPIEAHDWLHGSLKRSEDAINSQLSGGLAFLATVGSTAPFIGLFGTVVGIFRALIKIGAAGDASIGTVAGPVGEALIMTALGLVVAVPAVLAYNWLQARNKRIAEQLGSFSNDVLGHLASDGRVRPAVKGAKAAPKAPPVATTAKA
ncbi:MotA/TolQ/ExbB proton channel family protein [Sphingomonas sp.]|jgi:biopolymer transport protein ExbB|uniref:MotA/TolQ/ExbB proton channel family protein n=1 Tax=Sphingomonas sp. TaxID=28214 RepID=UPI00260D5908|nr:MotA/TolQ/ExbB proton channel family protein [Sphingomonas sp.]MDK2767630.1 MotA/TolQ/ExbB proton channel family protein [Sphingomonas sp.]